ncbi:hypothetical protein SeLEV6574_g03484 [Synchytrium endobioticum]|uniref:Dipeptidyl-peptidase V n=1 Tax=Synchytrium endobioticum TaxID=286115 RepID=A0A507D440_9FUNG|nr:hypothetical protein SeLEV6574_g03484 [Synchytrium endobioticum]
MVTFVDTQACVQCTLDRIERVETDHEILFFDECLEVNLMRPRLRLKKEATPFLAARFEHNHQIRQVKSSSSQTLPMARLADFVALLKTSNMMLEDQGHGVTSALSKQMATKYVYEPDFGEGYTKNGLPVIVTVSLTDHKTKVLELQVPAGQPVFSDNDSLICLRVPTAPIRYGVRCCTSRMMKLMKVSLLHPENETEITAIPSGWNARYPRITPDRKNLVYISNVIGGAHNSMCRIMIQDITDGRIGEGRVLVDIETSNTGAPLYLDKDTLIYPHGGPHAAFTTDYSLYTACPAALEYSVALVNYTGSIRYGESSIQALLGNIGILDVEDVHAVSMSLHEKDPHARFALFGGSHGGFLSAHLLGRHPDIYQCGVLRNPVMNVGAMYANSDIPDVGKAKHTKVSSRHKGGNYANIMQVMWTITLVAAQSVKRKKEMMILNHLVYNCITCIVRKADDVVPILFKHGAARLQECVIL